MRVRVRVSAARALLPAEELQAIAAAHRVEAALVRLVVRVGLGLGFGLTVTQTLTLTPSPNPHLTRTLALAWKASNCLWMERAIV